MVIEGRAAQRHRDQCGGLGYLPGAVDCPGCVGCCPGFAYTPRHEIDTLEQPHLAAREVAREQVRVVRRNRWS